MGLGQDNEINEYATALQTHLNKVARSDTEVSVHGVELSSPNLDRYMTEELLHSRQILKNFIQAQKEGYDAFCVGSTNDPAFSAIHEIADIPICFLSETSMLLACLLSPNFSILCHDDPLLRRVMVLVKRYGFQDRFIECDSFHLPIRGMVEAFKNPEVFLVPAREIAHQAKTKGVCMFVNGEGVFNAITAKHNIHDIEGIPVLEGSGAMVKVAEMLVDLKSMGIKRSNLGLYTSIPEPDLASMLKLYGLA
jgi:allantoin racemase